MFRPGMEKLPVYATEEPFWVHKLDANERSARLPLGVQREINRRTRKVESRRYPDIAAMSLRTRLAEYYGVKVEQVQVGNGSSELIATLCTAFGGSGRPVAYPWPSFSMYPIYASMADSPAIAIPLSPDFQLSVAKVLQTVEMSRPKLLMICNPNNPTGGLIPATDLRAILQGVSCPVLVDEAYQEYCGESCLPWLDEFPNLMVARTFSKAFGLAAARVGYVISSAKLSATIGKRILPYMVNSYSLAAAEACLDCREMIMPEVLRTAARRDRMQRKLALLPNVEAFPSATNFLLLRVKQADDLCKRLAARNIGVRNLSRAPDLEGCIRITVGAPAENDLVLAGIREYDSIRSGDSEGSIQYGGRK